MAYSELLRTACVRTKALGYGAPSIRDRSLPVELLFAALRETADIGKLLAERIGSPASGDLARACATLALELRPRFERAIGCGVVPTLGSVDYDGIRILSCDSEDLDLARRRACYHVWWSVGASQVVDITLMAHLALLKEAMPPRILPIVGAPDDIPLIAWRPHLVGEAVVRVLTGAPAPALST